MNPHLSAMSQDIVTDGTSKPVGSPLPLTAALPSIVGRQETAILIPPAPRRGRGFRHHHAHDAKRARILA
ncbi:MAG TPA: hypothetical protein VKA15_18600 [Isosphaeraceae bacterium]|nr:hypothetical protein [Isosphaeraceae bacterium]